MSHTTPTSLFVVELEPRTTPAALVAPQATPADPSVGSQWGLTAISAPRGWDTATGTGQTIVAVIDTGVDLTHPDLRANLWTNPGEIAGNGRDDDANGYVDDVNGWDFAGNDNNPTDERGHGTHVAGIIGAVGNNGIGGSGVAWKTRIMPLKMFDANGGGNTGGGARAIDYAVQNGAKIINCSWGGSAPDEALAAAIARAQAAGVIVVVAAGNAGRNNDTNGEFPANYAHSYTNTIAVAASLPNGQLAGWSNYSTSRVELAAPGEGIVSTARGGGTITKSGTSMSAPFVSGALAVLWDKHPTWTWQQVLAKLRSSVDVVAGMIGKTVTGGVLNLAKLLDAPVAPPVVPPPPVAPPVAPPPVAPPLGTTTRWTGAGARVVSGQFLGSAAGTFDRVRVAFDKRMNAPTFTAADVSLTGPTGAITVNGVSLVPDTDGTTFDVTFTRQSAAGRYTITVGPDVWDVTAQRMDQNGNGVNNEAADRYTLAATLGGSGANVAAIPGVLTGNTISDFRTTRATFAVTASKTVIDVSVTVDISHARTSDLQIRLTSPSGKQAVLFNRRGGANLTGATFTTGAFAGLRSQGEWLLEVFDVVNGEGGSIRSAGLLIS